MAGGAGEKGAEGLGEESEAGEEGRLPGISAGEVIHSDNGDLSYRIISQVRNSHTLIPLACVGHLKYRCDLVKNGKNLSDKLGRADN